MPQSTTKTPHKVVFCQPRSEPSMDHDPSSKSKIHIVPPPPEILYKIQSILSQNRMDYYIAAVASLCDPASPTYENICLD